MSSLIIDREQTCSDSDPNVKDDKLTTSLADLDIGSHHVELQDIEQAWYKGYAFVLLLLSLLRLLLMVGWRSSRLRVPIVVFAALWSSTCTYGRLRERRGSRSMITWHGRRAALGCLRRLSYCICSTTLC